MSTFLFYPFIADGACLSFESAQCVDDAAALDYARQVLVDHSQADHVEVWQGERRVGVRRRKTASVRVL